MLIYQQFKKSDWVMVNKQEENSISTWCRPKSVYFELSKHHLSNQIWSYRFILGFFTTGIYYSISLAIWKCQFLARFHRQIGRSQGWVPNMLKDPDKLHIFIFKMPISWPNPMSDHLLESSQTRGSNIGFSQEMTKVVFYASYMERCMLELIFASACLQLYKRTAW